MSYTTISTPPCKDCENRHARCHTTCSDYIGWSQKHKSEENKARKNAYDEKMVTDYQLSMMERNKKK